MLSFIYWGDEPNFDVMRMFDFTFSSSVVKFGLPD